MPFPPDSPKSRARIDLTLAAMIFLLAMWMRCLGLDVPSILVWDDYFTLSFSLRPLQELLRTLIHQPYDSYIEFQPPLNNLVVHAFLALGKSDVLARMFSVLSGSATAVVVYFLGVRLVGRPAALMAGLLVSCNLFLIELSQQIRSYSPYLFLAAASILTAWCWFERGGFKRLAVHVLVTTALLYTSYLSATPICVQVVWAVVVTFLLVYREGLSVPAAVGKMLPFALGLAACLVLYSPWIPQQLKVFGVLQGSSGNPDASIPARLLTVVHEFVSYYSDFMGYPRLGLAALGLALLGAVHGARKGRLLQTVFLLVWIGVTVGMVVNFNREALHAKTRYLINALPPLLLLAALGIDALRLAIAALLSRSRLSLPAQFATAAGCLLLLTWWGLQALPFHMRRDVDRLGDICFDMAIHRRDIGQAGLWGSDFKWFPQIPGLVWDWYLPGVFTNPASDFSRSYRRVFLLSTPEASPVLAGQLGVVPFREYGRMNLFVAGLANVSPLVVHPGEDGTYVHVEDFSSLAAYRDAYDAANLYLDKGSAFAADRKRLANLTYAFELPEGLAANSLTVSATAYFYSNTSGPPDSVLLLQSSRDGVTWSELARYSFVDLSRTKGGPGTRGLTVNAEGRTGRQEAGGRLYVRVVLDPGSRFGRIDLKRLAFSADVAGRAVPPEEAAVLQARNLAANASVTKWQPDVLTVAARPVLFDHRSNGRDAVPEATSALQLEAFKALNPRARMVWSESDGLGHVLFSAYDPDPAAPARPFTPGTAVKVDFGKARPEGMAASGEMHFPVFGLSGKGKASLPFDSKTPAWLNVWHDGTVTALIEPVFDVPERALAQLEADGKLIRHPDSPCLTCKDGSPCSATWRISSALPVRKAVVKLYPRWQADLAGRNGVDLSCSTDGGQTWTRLERFHGFGSGVWEGLYVPRTARITFRAPVKELLIRATLSGDGAQLWSSPVYPMRMLLEMAGDALALPDGDGFELSMAGPDRNAFTFQLLDGRASQPLPGLDTFLKRF